MTAKLPVTADRTVYGVDVNGSSRIEIFNAAGTAFEITNVPDTTPALGGKFPVLDAAAAQTLIEFIDTIGPVLNDYIGISPGDAGQGTVR